LNVAVDKSVTGGDGITVGGDARVRDIKVTYNTLADYQRIPDETKRQLRHLYERQLTLFPRNATLLVALALSYLDLDLYAEAVSYFQRALTVSPRDAQTLYYLALSSLNGRRPKNQSLQTIELIDRYLSAAYRLDPSLAHVSMLAAIIRYDYYLTNGMTPPDPSIEQLLQWVANGEWIPEEMQAIARFAAVPQSLASQLRLI
jgi:tetratricopeptide (TPR) repeat protein